jgi:DNA-binding CsgD family transcriptional regulator
VILLDRDLRPVDYTAAAKAWVDALPAANVYAALGMLPAMIYPVATVTRVRDGANGSHALERTVDGRWVMIEAATLHGAGPASVVVTLRGATSGETFDRLSRTFAFTKRERQVVSALLAGLDTRAITAHLFISRHTVQDHLKSVFDKAGVRSRRELLARFGGWNRGSDVLQTAE